MGHKMFQYWIYLVYKILYLSEVTIEMKEFLVYKLNKDLLLYNTNYQHVLIFNPVIYKLEHNGGLMSPQAKLNYKGHYMYPNMCHCTICHASARPPAFQSTVPYFPSSLDGMRNRKAQNGSRSSECGN